MSTAHPAPLSSLHVVSQKFLLRSSTSLLWTTWFRSRPTRTPGLRLPILNAPEFCGSEMICSDLDTVFLLICFRSEFGSRFGSGMVSEGILDAQLHHEKVCIHSSMLKTYCNYVNIQLFQRFFIFNWKKYLFPNPYPNLDTEFNIGWGS